MLDLKKLDKKFDEILASFDETKFQQWLNPYSQENLNFNTFIRTFERDVNNEELVWHSDEFDRIVTIMNDCRGWLLQFDNEVPKYLHKGDIIEIEKDRYHRLIKFDFDKTSKLIVKIQENICIEE